MFLNDKPLNDLEHDEFNRKLIIKKLYDYILINEGNSIVIGLTAEWGYGKTSVLQVLQQFLQKESEYVILNFNPWYYENSEIPLYLSFLYEFNSILDKSTKEVLKEYINKLNVKQVTPFINIINPNMGDILDSMLDNVLKDDNLFELKNKINNKINQSNNKYIIFIDDLDRLNYSQVKQVFDMIKTISNFNNVIYIIAYDKNYVIKSLENMDVVNSEEYIKKIVQLEIDLPKNTPDKIEEILFDKLNNLLKKYQLFIDYNRLIDFIKLSTDFFNNMRDIKIFINYVSFKFSLINLEEINIIDYLFICLIKQYDHKLYELIKNNKNFFVNYSYDDINSLPKYKYVYENLNDFYKSVNSKCNNKNSIDILEYLFPNFCLYNLNSKDYFMRQNYNIYEKRITSPYYFDLYFTLNKEDSLYNIDEINKFEYYSFKKIMELNVDTFYKYIKSIYFFEININDETISNIINYNNYKSCNYLKWYNIQEDIRRIINKTLYEKQEDYISLTLDMEDEYCEEYSEEDCECNYYMEIMNNIIQKGNLLHVIYYIWSSILNDDYFNGYLIKDDDIIIEKITKRLYNELIYIETNKIIFILEKWNFLTNDKHNIEPNNFIKSLNIEDLIILLKKISKEISCKNVPIFLEKIISFETIDDILDTLDLEKENKTELYENNKELFDTIEQYFNSKYYI